MTRHPGRRSALLALLLLLTAATGAAATEPGSAWAQEAARGSTLPRLMAANGKILDARPAVPGCQWPLWRCAYWKRAPLVLVEPQRPRRR